MNIEDFKEKFDEYYKYVKSSGHDIEKTIEFYLDDLEHELEIKDIELKQLIGCGCESGIVFYFCKKENK